MSSENPFMRGYMRGQALKRQSEQDALDAEDRKYKIERDKTELKLRQLDHDQKVKEATRAEALQFAQLANGQPAPTSLNRGGGITTPALQTQGAPVPTDFSGTMGAAPAPQVTTPLQHPPVTIPGAYGPDTQVQPKTAEQLLMERKKAAYEANQAEAGKPRVLNQGDILTAGGQTIASNPKPEALAAAAAQRNIDPLSPEGIAARLQFEKGKPVRPTASGGGTGSAGGGNRSDLVKAVLDNPTLWDNLTPTIKSAIAPDLAKAGFAGFGKPLSEGAINKLSDARAAIMSLTDLREVLKANEKFIGPLSGLQALNPYSDARKAQADIDRVKQRVGKALEGGVLRKEDEDKYKKILATLTDTPATAIYKTDSLIRSMESDIEVFTDEQKKAGRRIGETTPTGGTVKMKAPNGQTKDVPASEVEHYKSLGATVVK